MNFRFTIVERSLNREEFRWKWLKFWRYTFILGSLACLLFLSLCGAILAGTVTSKFLASALLAGIGIGGLIGWIVILLGVLSGTADRNWIARTIEKADNRLLDRLNTLLFLESRVEDAHSDSFALRIAKQTQALFAEKPPPPALSASGTWPYFCSFVVLAAAAGILVQKYSPWHRLMVAEKKGINRVETRDRHTDLALPATNNVEQNRIWGEVRITDPGADLKVTKLDVIPLQIEAAANQPLTEVAWHSAINGAEEAQHPLPPPAEPRYAVYQPSVYLDEFHLSDWDVMTYYARAKTDAQNSYGSQLYFLEVRPFQEDILKLPGGENGQAHRCFNELSALINGQQHIIRQTHQHLQRPLEQEKLQQQDRKKLAEAEDDLADSTQHLYARMAAEMEGKPISDALDNLAKAQKSLEQAGKQLSSNLMKDAQNRERGALAELVAARKMFQKVITDNPTAFDEPMEEPSPVTDDSKKLTQIAEFRDESKAVQEFVQNTLEKQQALERQASSAKQSGLPKLGKYERDLAEALRNFQQEHPKVFRGIENESQKAGQEMVQAAESLQQDNDNARKEMHEATESVEKLNEALRMRSTERQLTDAYKLKQMLDQQIQTFSKCSNPGSGVPDTILQHTTGKAQDTINQLKKIAEQEPTRDMFGQPLREALSGQNKVELDATLTRLRQSQTETDKQQGSSEASERLSKVRNAFKESEPKALQAAQQNDSLKPSDQDSFNQGMANLESLLKQLMREHPISRESQGKQAKEALFNLQTGLRSQFGDNDRGNQILLQLEQMLKAEGLDVADLKKLMDELQHFSVESSDKRARKEDKPEFTNIDPTRLPPAYRGRIQKYFQRLSEK